MRRCIEQAAQDSSLIDRQTPTDIAITESPRAVGYVAPQDNRDVVQEIVLHLNNTRSVLNRLRTVSDFSAN